MKWLEKKWWMGVGALAAVLMLMVVMFQEEKHPNPQQPNPWVEEFRKLETLSPQAPSSYLHVRTGTTYRTTTGVERYRAVTIDQNAVVEIAGAGTWILNTLSLEIGDSVEVVARGISGADGKNGRRGRDGANCASGTDGSTGEAGTNGSPSKIVEIRARTLQLPTQPVRVDTRGGRGGNGGAGGDGGNGGRADRSETCGGGNGGKGGNGGGAAVGGAGGNFFVRYTVASAKTEDGRVISLDANQVADRFKHLADGGESGQPGSGGKGGDGGRRRGAGLPGTGQPPGSAGSDGQKGPTTQQTALSGMADIAPVVEEGGT